MIQAVCTSMAGTEQQAAAAADSGLDIPHMYMHDYYYNGLISVAQGNLFILTKAA